MQNILLSHFCRSLLFSHSTAEIDNVSERYIDLIVAPEERRKRVVLHICFSIDRRQCTSSREKQPHRTSDVETGKASSFQETAEIFVDMVQFI